MLFRFCSTGIALSITLMIATHSYAQSFGIELHNTMTPASGGMAGASLTRPQDLQSAINGNPATLTQFKGTQFSFGGGWAEPTYNVTQLDPLPLVGVDPFSGKSGTPGSTVPAIGVTQDFSSFGLPLTTGLALIGNAGAGVEFRGIPASGGTSAEYVALDLIAAAGMQVTDRLSVGGSFVLGTSYLDGPFVDLTGMVPAYGIRGSLGVNYELTEATSTGFYYQTKKHFNFDDAVLFGFPPPDGTISNIRLDHPVNLGLGVANSSLLDGRLLVAVDALYKLYGDADFFQSIYDNQWVLQFGTQYSLNPHLQLRLGYAWNENPMRDAVGRSIGGVDLPDGIPALRYVQGQFAAISQHRLTGGIGIRDLLPGLDVDLFAGGMFENTEQFASTIASVESYWVGFGTTWRFGRGSAECGSWW